MTPDAYQIEVKRLRWQLDEAREEIRQLKESIQPPKMFLPNWKLFPTEQRILSAFYLHHDLHEETIRRLLKHPDPVSLNIVRVHICHLRRKIKPRGVVIKTVHSWGYRLAPESIPVIQAALQQQLAA